MANYATLTAIQQSNDFINRSTMAVANYAHFILGQTPSGTAAQWNDKLRWAMGAIQNPRGIATQLAAYFVLDATFTGLPNGTTDSTTITDAQFDTVVQTAINNTLLSF